MASELAQSTTKLSADRLSFFLFTTLVDKHAHILVKSLPNCQDLVHISVHTCIPYRLALSSKAISCGILKYFSL